jgi:arsenate reductase
MAHGFLQSFDKHLQIFSAGTKPTLQVNPIAIKVMQEIGVDISHNTPKNVELYLNDTWDYVITVCGEAKEICPTFIGKVKKQIHIGFEDPSEVKGTNEFILSEYRRVRDEIKQVFWEFYNNLK